MKNSEYVWEIPIDDVEIYIYHDGDFSTNLAVDKTNNIIFAVTNFFCDEGKNGLHWFIGKRPQDIGLVERKKRDDIHAWGMITGSGKRLGFNAGGECYIEVEK